MPSRDNAAIFPRAALLAMLVAATVLLTPGPAAAAGASFTALGQLPGSIGDTEANGVSGDGSVVVGFAWVNSSDNKAFRWTAQGGYEILPDLGPGQSRANDASFDGSVVVGQSQFAAVRWTGSGVEQIPLYDSSAVNADGTVVVDYLRWVAPGTTNDFGSLGGQSTRAFNVSADGQVAVGYSETAGGNRFVHAFRWTPTGGIKDLGVTGGTESIAWGISGDGAVVVGEARDQTGFWRAFRWTSSTSMKDIGTLGGPMSHASEASRDGSVVVGWSLTSGSSASDHAFWWTAKAGMRDLKTELQARGVTGLENWLLYAATGLSDDGSVIVGVARNLVTHEWQPFRAVLPVVTSTPTPTPTATSSRTPTPSPTSTATPRPTGSATPTATPSRSPRR